MILDLIENYILYSQSGNNIARAFDYLVGNEYAGLQSGKHQIVGDEVFAIINEYETKPAEGGFYEAHRDYIDLQYMVSGSEMIHLAHDFLRRATRKSMLQSSSH